VKGPCAFLSSRQRLQVANGPSTVIDHLLLGKFTESDTEVMVFQISEMVSKGLEYLTGKWSSLEMVSISPDVEFHIRQNYAWSRLPPSVKAVSGKTVSLSPRLKIKLVMIWIYRSDIVHPECM